MNDTQLEQLREALQRESRHIQPVGLGTESVRRRGRRRRNRGRAIVAVGAVTCVAGLGASIVERGSGGTPQRVVVGTQPGAVATPSLEFRVVDGTVSNASTHFTTSAGVTYDLSTAPGTVGQGTDPGQAIYSTTDGEHWTTAKQDTAWISDLTEHNGVLYAIGTAPGAGANDVQYRLATSHDGGTAWSDEDLPFDLNIPTASVPLSRSSSVQVASGANATVAVMTEYFSPNLDALVAATAAGRPDVSARMTAAGYDIVDMSGCTGKIAVGAKVPTAAANAKVRAVGLCADAPVLRRVSWSDIGLSGSGELSHQEMLVSTDGAHWLSTAAPTTGSVTNLVATNDGFLLLAQNSDPSFGAQPTSITTSLLHSTDAHTWTPVATPPGLNVQAIAADEIVGIDASGDVQTSTDGGATWNATAVSSLLPAGAPASSISSADAGPLGFAVLVAPNSEMPGHDSLLFSADGISWTTTNLTSVGEPPTGYPMQVTVGADHVSVDYGGPVTAPGGTMKITTLLGTPKR